MKKPLQHAMLLRQKSLSAADETGEGSLVME
jgi:hypothetical protein